MWVWVAKGLGLALLAWGLVRMAEWRRRVVAWWELPAGAVAALAGAGLLALA